MPSTRIRAVVVWYPSGSDSVVDSITHAAPAMGFTVHSVAPADEASHASEISAAEILSFIAVGAPAVSRDRT